MEPSFAKVYYDKLQAAIDAGKFSCEEDVIHFLHKEDATKHAVLLGDIEPFTLKFHDNSTLQIEFTSTEEFLDIDVKHGYFVPTTKH